MLRSLASVSAACLIACNCASAPRQTEASRHIQQNPRATVEGRVEDEQGRPVAGIGVRGIPRASDVPWVPEAVTRCDGTFRLDLPAPAAYSFYLRRDGRTVITPSPEDPARVSITVDSGRSYPGVTLVLLSELWIPVVGSAPPDASPSCP
jgi:hypothetical protein